MADGMKKGSTDDPFAESEDEQTTTSSSDAVLEDSADQQPAPTTDSAATDAGADTDAAPYLERRDGAKDDRDLVQFFLRDEVYSDTDEQQLRLDVADELGTDLPGKFDLREALVAVGQEHVDEVSDELREMGYGED